MTMLMVSIPSAYELERPVFYEAIVAEVADYDLLFVLESESFWTIICLRR